MNIVDQKKSKEICISVDWMAYDFFLEKPLSENEILKMKSLGSFVYLKSLKQPFFKVENNNFIIKGIEGNKFFRVSFCTLSSQISEIEDLIKRL